MSKIESQHNDTIVIPEGYRAVVENGRITFQKEFKDGDVLHSTTGSNEILIFKKNILVMMNFLRTVIIVKRATHTG